MPETDIDTLTAKITVSLPKRTYEDLRANSKASGMSMTEFIRRAIALYDFVIENENSEIVLREKDTKTETLVKIA